MPLRHYFDDQIAQLNGFFAGLDERVRCVQVAPDIREFLVKVLAGMQEPDDFHHTVLLCDAPFESAKQYAAAVLTDVRESLAVWREPLEQAGFHLRWPESEMGPWLEPMRLVRCVSALADSLPEDAGALVLILLPGAVSDAAGFREFLSFVARETASLKAKFLLVDEQKPPVFVEVPEPLAERIGLQAFALSPETIEAGVRDAMADPERFSPRELRQFQAMLGAFAFARHDLDEAQRLQEDLLQQLGPFGPADERASAFYNLGNTLLDGGDAETAERCFAEALDLAQDEGVVALVPMALSNLGVTLHKLGRVDEALEAFQVAQQTCQANHSDLLEAHVLDSMARIYQLEKRPEEAEQCWQRALTIYNQLQSTAAAPIKQAGSADVVDHLRDLYQQTLQMGKLAELELAGKG